MSQDSQRKASVAWQSLSLSIAAAIISAAAATALTIAVEANEKHLTSPRTRRPIDSFQLVSETFLLNLRNRSRRDVVHALKLGDRSSPSGQHTEGDNVDGDKRFSFFRLGFSKSDHVTTIEAYQRWPQQRAVIEFAWVSGDLYCSDFPGSHRRCN
jgi:hypothetical protein